MRSSSKTYKEFLRPASLTNAFSVTRLRRQRAQPAPVRGSGCWVKAAVAATTAATAASTTERLLQKRARKSSSSGTSVSGGLGGDTTLEGLRRADAAWAALKKGIAMPGSNKDFAVASPGQMKGAVGPEYDVAICGGILGVFLACSLQQRGANVVLIERGKVKGRAQEWNIAPNELHELVQEGVLTRGEIDEATRSSWPRSRVAIETEGFNLDVEGVLNLGVSPEILVEKALQRFKSLGGAVLEGAGAQAVNVFDNGVHVTLQTSMPPAETPQQISARLLIDAMGARSPLVAQARNWQRPDAVCLVVGSMVSGFPEGEQGANAPGDFLASLEPASSKWNQQYFWEAFPAGSGPDHRTTYMFTYALPRPGAPQLEELYEEYWQRLPDYQNLNGLDELQIERLMFSCFTAHRDSPLQSKIDRILFAGDAAGLQSPLSFGGFACLCRHLGRLSGGVMEALEADCLQADELGMLNPYMPNLSVQWAMAKALAEPPKDQPEFVNRVMGGVMKGAHNAGDEVLYPFLQDNSSIKSLSGMIFNWFMMDPGVIPVLLQAMGPQGVSEGVVHAAGMALYTVGHHLGAPLIRPLIDALPEGKVRYQWRRQLEAWEFGSGADYKH